MQIVFFEFWLIFHTDKTVVDKVENELKERFFFKEETFPLIFCTHLQKNLMGILLFCCHSAQSL